MVIIREEFVAKKRLDQIGRYLRYMNLSGGPTCESQPCIRYLDLLARSVFFLFRVDISFSASSDRPPKAPPFVIVIDSCPPTFGNSAPDVCPGGF